MGRLRGKHRTILLSACCLWFLFGCSSMPRNAAKKTEQSGRAQNFLDQGHKYYRTGMYPRALASLKKALALNASVDNESAVAQTLSSMGRVHLAMDDLDKAQACFQQAHKAALGLHQPELLALAKGGLGAVQLHRQQPQKAQTWFLEALELPLDNTGSTRATLLHDLGSASRKLGQDTVAESYFQQALTMHKPLRDFKGMAADCYSLALLYEAQGHLEQALQNARRALSHDKKAQIPPNIAQDLTLLGRLSFARGEMDEAGDYYRRAKLAWQALGRQDQIELVNQSLQKINSSF